ncbi:helix-turn-helix transcriptional regulator [Ancylobacter sp. 6x-1]|uniref:Helix-turn-helix transcriptional regulator n=1 Tax=Ancylobacter crimeensis TaxID=2579147 RepID=A0ABT0DE95_9HYPH|nr:helix-turn-helix domain-containing protein [Ancylobacter crimeensis]MCK0198293.1 helix-turn-helix transcriptional regulator [Ancylobacter crimeensis]
MPSANPAPIPAPSAPPDLGYSPDCPIRGILDRLGDKWSYLLVLHLSTGPKRFGALRRGIDDISQRMLTETLRNLQRDGLIARTVFPTTPPSVEYRLTLLGISLLEPMNGLVAWAARHSHAIAGARATYDAAATGSTSARAVPVPARRRGTAAMRSGAGSGP